MMHARQRCDECGRDMTKATRVLRGHAYCLTCYAREFSRSRCPRCGKVARLPKRDVNAVCKRCEAAGSCIRCKRTGRPVGRLTPSGPACASCANFFRRIERSDTEAPFLPAEVAPRQPAFGTCSLCRRHRRLYAGAENTRLCKVCLRDGMRSCPCCQQSMPAGYGTRCESCYWLDLFERRLVQNRALFTFEIHERLFVEYACWHRSKRGAKVAAMRLPRDASFFADLASLCNDGLPSALQILERFTSRELNGLRYATGFLRDQCGIDVTAQKQSAAEHQHIVAIERGLNEQDWRRKTLAVYRDDLLCKVNDERLSIRSARFYLRAALTLLETTAVSRAEQLSANVATRYLARYPGQRASLGPFLRFLKIDISVTELRSCLRRNAKRALIAMLRNKDKQPIDNEWIPLALQCFHGLSAVYAHRLAKTCRLEIAEEAITVHGKNVAYYLPRARCKNSRLDR